MKLKKSTKSNLITYCIMILLFAAATVMVQTGNASRHMQSMLVPICINIILAVSLNLTIGILGDLSLGHAGFMSVGAYSGCLFSIFTKDMLPSAVRFPLSMLIGAIVAAMFGALIGTAVLRLNGDYLAIVTLAFGEIIRSVIINLGFTGGAAGLKGTPQDSTFTIAFIMVMITLIVILNLIYSKHGRAFMAIRDNSIAAEACGVNIKNYKLMAFVISAAFAGIAGVLYGHNLSILTAGTFDYNMSIEILVMVVLGGIGSIRGSVISAIVITILPEALRFMKDYRMLIYAIVLIAVMIFNSSEKTSQIKSKLAYIFKKGRKEVAVNE